jgi:DNA polymerase III beta subunit
LKANTDVLQTAVKKAIRFVAQKSTVPVYSHFLLDTRSGTLKISAFDTEGSCEWDTGIEANPDDLYVTVPGKLFHGDIIGITNDVVDLTCKKEKLIIKTERHQAKLMTFPGDEFLSIPHTENFKPVDIRFLDALERCAIAVDANRKPAIMGGVFMRVENGVIEAYGTDGVRAGRYCVDFGDESNFEISVPKNLASNIASGAKGAEEIYIDTNGNSLSLKTPNAIFTSQLLDGNYPSVWTFFERDKQNHYTITVSGSELADALKRTMIYVTNMDGYIVMNVSKNTIRIQANTYDKGSGEIEIPATSDIDDLEIAINVKFLYDFVRLAKGVDVIFKVEGHKSPVLIQGLEGFDYIIMPMNIR